MLCDLMEVSRAGYYKWKNHEPTNRDYKRAEILAVVKEVHDKHSTHGYRWTAAFIRINYNYDFSDNYIYKAYQTLGIKAETRHKVHSKPRKVKDKYPNLIFTTWETVDRPRQVIVSDMTVLKTEYYMYFELTMYFDVFTKQVLSYRLTRKRGDRNQYIEGLEDIVRLLERQQEPTIVHTDQGSVYASMAYNELIKETCIIRSMSRAGKPTDNPVNESLNGWIKEELYIDFRLGDCKSEQEVRDLVDRYVIYYNSQRPCYALGYDTPDRYYKRYVNGELEKKDTFSKRILSEEPKFVRKRRDVSASVNENDKKESSESTSING